jgi:Zn-dependent peptidase ImmA (M78 family)
MVSRNVGNGPRGSVFANAPKLASVDRLLKLKKYWTVSVAALAYRLHAVGILSEWQYRQLYIELSGRGYRKREPDGAPRETSQVWAKVFAVLRTEGISKRASRPRYTFRRRRSRSSSSGSPSRG